MTHVTVELRELDRADLGEASALLAAACPHDAAAAVAEEKLFGTVPGSDSSDTLGAFVRDHLVGLVATAGQWLRLLAVHPEVRGRGIGTALLAAGESAATRAKAARLRTLDQPGNYLSPGIDDRAADDIAWLERRGYRRVGENTNLIVDVAANPRITEERVLEHVRRLTSDGYTIRRARQSDRADVCAFAADFAPAWAFEVASAIGHEPSGVWIAVAQGEGRLAAFAAHDGNNRGLGWFGPAATALPHRRMGIGEALFLACLHDVAVAGHQVCEIAWIGPRKFYERIAGITGERRFVVLAKELG